MTHDEIIEMAKQSGIAIYSGLPWINDDDATVALTCFASVVAEREREVCAEIARTIVTRFSIANAESAGRLVKKKILERNVELEK
jgi:hypothetical protein